jgi:hypothetical protein
VIIVMLHTLAQPRHRGALSQNCRFEAKSKIVYWKINDLQVKLSCLQ